MTTGFRNASGTDFDDVFDPYVQGTKPGATGYRTSDGVDLNQRFAPLSFGTAAAVQGYRLASGADVNTLWAGKGTAQYSLPINGQTFTGYSSGAVSSAMAASATFTAKADGTYSVICVGNNIVTSPANGTWLPSGDVVTNYQAQFGVTQVNQGTNGPATITNGAAAYAALTSNRAVAASCTTGQHGGLELGGTYTVVIQIKNISTGAVSTTTITFAVQSAGAA